MGDLTLKSVTKSFGATRAVGVVSGLLSKTERAKNEGATRDEYIRIREQYARGQEVMARALAPRPEDRFETADAMAQALVATSTHSTTKMLP